MAIQLFKPTFHIDECLEQIRECLEAGWTGLGFKTVEFEKKWCEYTGHKHAHFLNSATEGLRLAVEILKRDNGWSDGDEIISTPITFVSTNHAILYSHLKARFADVDEYLCLDPVDVERKISPKTRAVIFVGYGGRVGQLEKIIELCKKHNLKLILDAAHMSGTRMNGVFPGTLPGIDVAVYSYQAVKNLPTADSGMICFAKEEHDKLCRELTWLGINKDTYARANIKGNYKWKYDVEYLGYKSHGNSVIASIGLVQLKYLDEDNAARRRMAALYDELFRDNPKVHPVSVNYKDECSYHIYAIEVDDRDGLIQALNDADIYPGVHYLDNTEYRMYAYDHGTCPNAHRVSGRVISLPLHLRLTPEDIRAVADVVNAFTSK